MNASLRRALALFVDGEKIDWEGLLEDAGDDAERALLIDMRGLAELDQVPESASAGDSRTDLTVGASAAGRSAGRRRWGYLELLDEIGHGAYGSVHRAWDTRLAREVALKLLDDDPSGRSLDEARRLARISHPNVVTVYGADRHDGRVGLWMELLSGRTLDRMLDEQGPFSARETIAIGLDICSAVAAIHAAGLVHRDIKAQNVMRQPGGRMVVMDLGASVETPRDDVATQSLAGTPLYMAPELFKGAHPSALSDVYAIGVLLYRLVTGKYPLEAKTMGDLRRAYAASAPLRPLRDARPDLPRALVTVVERCLSPEPRDRFANIARLEQALHEADGGSRPQRTRPVWPFIAAGVLACATAIALIWARGATFTPPSGLTREQLKIAQGFEDLAASLGANGEWRQAIERYREAEQIYRVSATPDSAIIAQTIARIAFAQHQAGDLDRARSNYQLAISKFESNFSAHPLLETAVAGLAAVEQSMGKHDDAARTIARALQMRARMLTAPSGAASDVDPGLVRRLSELGSRFRIDRDEDGDWIPDLLEVAMGSDPRSPDSDGNGISDGDEAPNHDGVTNFVRFGLTCDPSKVVAQYGATDPASVGFQQPANRPFAGAAVASLDGTAAGWKVPSVGQSLYFLPLTSVQRSAAMTRGWRLMTRGRLHSGIALTSVDFTPDGPRFDINLVPNSHDIDVRLTTSVVPYEGVNHGLPGSRWPLLQLEYHPETQSAQLIVNGAIASTPAYRGHRQFQEGLGLFFGTFSEIVNVPRSEADFNLAVLVIR